MNEESTVQEAVEDDWDIDVSDVEDDEAEPGEAEESEKPEVEAEGDKSEAEATPAAPVTEPEADHSFTLKYMDGTRTVTRDEAITLAQKGLDYDRIRQGRDEALADKQELSNTLSALSEIAKTQGISLDELVDNAHAAYIAQKDGTSFEDAKKQVKFERRERELAAREEALKSEASAKQEQDGAVKRQETKRQEDIQGFLRDYPGVNPATIPPEVWANVAQGASLSAAYAKHENAQLRLQLEADKKNRENAEKSAGSRDTAGNKGKQDEIDRLWYDD